MWCMCLGVYLLRFITLGTKINKKYRNFSVLITEQVLTSTVSMADAAMLAACIIHTFLRVILSHPGYYSLFITLDGSTKTNTHDRSNRFPVLLDGTKQRLDTKQRLNIATPATKDKHLALSELFLVASVMMFKRCLYWTAVLENC